uniref:Uncharacterized protein n=1 Tax=viral metagenome TaxID=1070528 RepID=A0A6C0M2I0_9ZZZZ
MPPNPNIAVYSVWGLLLLFAIKAERQEVTERGGYPAVCGYRLEDVSGSTPNVVCKSIALYDSVVGWRRILMVATAFALVTGYILGILADAKACMLMGIFAFASIYHLAQYERYHVWYPIRTKMLESAM